MQAKLTALLCGFWAFLQNGVWLQKGRCSHRFWGVWTLVHRFSALKTIKKSMKNQYFSYGLRNIYGIFQLYFLFFYEFSIIFLFFLLIISIRNILHLLNTIPLLVQSFQLWFYLYFPIFFPHLLGIIYSLLLELKYLPYF